MTTIEGEKINTELETPPAVASETSHQVAIFNPLHAEPIAFKHQLERAQENFDQLAAFIRDKLIPELDFGRIHHANKKKCPAPWHCSYEAAPHHWSDYQLLTKGADKTLGLLGLKPAYPNYDDYVRACALGRPITDVLIKCELLGYANQVVEEGMGACSRHEVNDSLNNCLKRACKRARVDAVLRIPGVSAVFEPDFLAQVAAEAARKKGGNSTTARTQQVNQKYNTGATLNVWPLKGKGMEGERFDSFDDDRIAWILREFQDKPDIFNAAKRVYDARGTSASSDSIPPPNTADGPAKDSAGGEEQGSDATPAGPVTSEYDDYPEAQ